MLTTAPVVQVYPSASSPEMVSWGKLTFMPQADNDRSGLLFGAAKVDIYATEDIGVAAIG